MKDPGIHAPFEHGNPPSEHSLSDSDEEEMTLFERNKHINQVMYLIKKFYCLIPDPKNEIDAINPVFPRLKSEVKTMTISEEVD